MARAKANPIDKPPMLRRGYRIELNRKYFSHHNGREPPFTRGVAYKILEVVDNVKGYERTPFTKDRTYERKAVILLDDEGMERKIDPSFLARPGWWAAHRDDSGVTENSDPGHVISLTGPCPDTGLPEEMDEAPAGLPGPPEADDAPPEPQEETFGQALRRYREAAGLQQKELAERLGIRSRGYISMLESDKRGNYRGSSIRKLADALGLDGDDRELFYAAGGYRAEEEASLDDGFCAVLRKHRSRLMSQDELSEMIGISRSYIAHIERGSKQPSLKATIRMADALKLEGDKRREFFLLAGYSGMGDTAQGALEPEASEMTEERQDDL